MPVQSLHELPSSEGREVLRGEFKPLAVLAPILKAPVPVLFDASRVIGLNRVDDLRRLGKLDDKFSFSTAQSVRSANLVEAASLHQVDVAQFAGGGLLRNSLCVFGIGGFGRHSTEFCDIILASVPAKLLQLRGERPLSTEPPEGIVTRKRGIASGLEPDFAHHWESTQFPHKPSEIV